MDSEDTDSKVKKIQTTVRMEVDLHARLSDYVHDRGKGLAPKEKPSADFIIQEAIRLLLDRNAAHKSTASGKAIVSRKSVPPSHGLDSNSTKADLEFLRPLPPEHRIAVEKLLRILNQGSATVRAAILGNLDGFIEPIQQERPGDEPAGTGSSISQEVFEDLLQTVDGPGGNEAAFAKFMELIRKQKAKAGGISPKHPKTRKSGSGGGKPPRKGHGGLG